MLMAKCNGAMAVADSARIFFCYLMCITVGLCANMRVEASRGKASIYIRCAYLFRQYYLLRSPFVSREHADSQLYTLNRVGCIYTARKTTKQNHKDPHRQDAGESCNFSIIFLK